MIPRRAKLAIIRIRDAAHGVAKLVHQALCEHRGRAHYRTESTMYGAIPILKCPACGAELVVADDGIKVKRVRT